MQLKTSCVIRFAEWSSFETDRDNWLHCKTVPYYIFAQTSRGHYELEHDGGAAVCEEGGAFFVPCGTPLRIRHRTGRGGRMAVRFFHFMIEDARGRDIFADREIPETVSAADCRAPVRILRELLSKGAGEANAAELNGLVLRLAGLLFGLTAPKSARGEVPARIEAVCRMIDAHPEKAHESGSLPRLAGASRSKFYADFHAALGMSPAEYVRRRRMEYAMRFLLKHREMKIKEISELCGWRNPYHFSREFKRFTGSSPRRYQREPLY